MNAYKHSLIHTYPVGSDEIGDETLQLGSLQLSAAITIIILPDPQKIRVSKRFVLYLELQEEVFLNGQDLCHLRQLDFTVTVHIVAFHEGLLQPCYV